MNEAAEAGFVFAAVMGGETSFGGNEVVVIMTKDPAQPAAPSNDKVERWKAITSCREIFRSGFTEVG